MATNKRPTWLERDADESTRVASIPIAFGLFDYTMAAKINRLLKPHGLRLKVKSNRRWGDQVQVTVERIRK